MSFNRFDPRRRFMNFRSEFDRFVDDFFNSDIDYKNNRGDVIPRVSIEDNPELYVVRVELPGLKKGDVDVTYQDEKLYIVGEKKEEKENAPYLKNERLFGKIDRAIELPIDIKSEQIEAQFENGLLTVKLPKAEEVRDRGYKVNIN